MSSASLVDVGSLTFALASGQTYLFEFRLNILQTVTGTTGWSAAFSGTNSRFLQELMAVRSNTGAVAGLVGTASNTALVEGTARSGSTPGWLIVRGAVTTTSSGNLTIKAQTSAGNCRILAGSSGSVIAVTLAP